LGVGLNMVTKIQKLKMRPLSIFLLAVIAVSFTGLTGVAHAAEEDASSGSGDGSKLIGAGLAFGLAAMGAGIGLGYVGSAGLAVITENPALQSKVFIFIGMVESIAIYGIVMMFITL
jgi:V/A-type H+-transporting ATPase subunit K